MNDTIKRGLSVLLALSMVTLSAAGCGNGKGENSSSSSSTASSGGEKAVVDIFQFKVEIAEQLQKAIDVYTKDHPNVTINLETVGGGDDYGAALRAKMQSGNPAEIYNIGGPQDTLDWMGKLEDLSDEPWVEHAAEGTLQAVTVDGKVFGLPYAIEGYGLIYNKAIFEDAGINTNQLNSFAQIESAFAALKQKIDAGEMREKYPILEAVFELPAKETWVTGLHTLNLAFTNEYVGPMEVFDAKSIDFMHADALKALIDLQAKYTTNGTDLAKLNAVDYNTQVGGGIAIERVACIQQGNWIYGDVAQVDETVAENLDMMPLPLKGVNEDSIPIGVPMYWAVNSQSSAADKQAAKDFLNWLYQSEEGKEIVVKQFGFIPPFLNYGGLEPNDPLAKRVKQFVTDGKTKPWVFMGFPTDWGQGTFGTELQRYFAGKSTWGELVDTAKNKWAELRKSVSGS